MSRRIILKKHVKRSDNEVRDEPSSNGGQHFEYDTLVTRGACGY